jgi:hypothetical protein
MTGGVLIPPSQMQQLPGESDDAWLNRRQAAASKFNGGQYRAYIRPKTPDQAAVALATLGTTLPPLPPPKKTSRPKIHAADIPEWLPQLDSPAFHKRLGEVSAARAKGDPLAGNLAGVGRVVFWMMSTRIRLTIAQIGRRAGCCQETARRCLDFLIRHGLFGALNVLIRVDSLLLRSANLYLAPAFFVASAARLSRRVAERSAAFIVECGRLLGLAVRPTGGLNTTPMKPQPGFT